MTEEFALSVKSLGTPYKLSRPVLEPTGKLGDFDSLMVDCPFVFFHDGRWWMTYVGFDGEGYRTGLAVSENLIDFERRGMILDWGKPREFDAHGAAGVWILRKNDLFSLPKPRKWRGFYWMTYVGFGYKGYEAGPGAIGLAYSRDLIHWKRFNANPILKSDDGAYWESGGLYKSCLIQHRDEGETFYLFYNAKNKSYPWIEQTGFAISANLQKWRRYEGNPVVRVGSEGSWDCRFVSDPFIVLCKDAWVMFYYGFDGVHAQDGIAFSKDLRNWHKWPGPVLNFGPPGSIDSQHAHKPCVIWRNGIFHHFYCAVRDKDGYRTISVARSQPMINDEPSQRLSRTWEQR